jgi:hypothetical protein
MQMEKTCLTGLLLETNHGCITTNPNQSMLQCNGNAGAEVGETTVNRLPCHGFRCTGKVIRQVNQCWWRICQEKNVFFTFEYYMFYVLYPIVTYLLTLPHKNLKLREERNWKIMHQSKPTTKSINTNVEKKMEDLHILQYPPTTSTICGIEIKSQN